MHRDWLAIFERMRLMEPKARVPNAGSSDLANAFRALFHSPQQAEAWPVPDRARIDEILKDFERLDRA